MTPSSASAAMAQPGADEIAEHARAATAVLKAMSHERRLMILCHLAEGEKSVTELEQLLGVRQSAVSQQLARLRFEGLVDYRRDGKAMIYSIADDRVREIAELICRLFGPGHD